MGPVLCIRYSLKDLKDSKKRTPHDLYEYTAAPSVQRRGGITIITTPTKRTGDNCDDLNLRFDDLPLHEEGGEFVTGVPSHGGAPAAPSKRTDSSGGRPVGLKAKHGDKLFTLAPASSIEVLKLLEAHDWPAGVHDIGLTLEKGSTRLGVLTILHLNLAMNLNYHMQRHLTGYHWSTIANDTHMQVNEERKWRQGKMSALLTMGCYTTGTVYDKSGTLQISDALVDTVFAIGEPYASIPPRGKRYVIHLHNENHSERILPEDRRLLRSVGFNIDGRPPTVWQHLEYHPGACPL